MTIVSTHIVDLVENGRMNQLSASDDGRLVAYMDDPDLASPAPGELGITLADTVSGAMRAVRLALDPALRAAALTAPDLSGDGRYLAFLLTMPGGNPSVVRLDLGSGELRYVSTAADGTGANGSSGAPSMSREGRYVAFASGATNLVDGDTSRWQDIYVKDMQTGKVQRLSSAPDGTTLTNESRDADLSADGKVVLFTHMPAGAQQDGLYAHNLDTGKVTLINASPDGGVYSYSLPASASADGRYAVFATTGYPGSPPQVFRKDLQTGELLLVEERAITSIGASEPRSLRGRN